MKFIHDDAYDDAYPDAYDVNAGKFSKWLLIIVNPLDSISDGTARMVRHLNSSF